jgi:hypothetical protein
MLDALPELSEECFFIAPIGLDGSAERERSDGVLEFIVDRAAQELNLTAVRADEIAHPGQITLQVIDHILGARAAVADVTGLNPNVFYELAVRHTARLPVAIIAEKDCKLPFDIAQMRTIFFESTNLRSADQCRKGIVAQLSQALERGAVDSPIATSIDMRALASGSTVERNIAEIITTLEDVARAQRGIAKAVERLPLPSTADPPPVSNEEARLAIADILVAVRELREFASDKEDDDLEYLMDELQKPIRFLAHKYLVTTPPSQPVLDLPGYGERPRNRTQGPPSEPDGGGA